LALALGKDVGVYLAFADFEDQNPGTDALSPGDFLAGAQH
jgi:hypothetical protein